MVNQLLLGLWICAVTLGGIYAGDIFAAPSEKPKTLIGKLEYTSHDPITAPVIEGGEIRGYVIVKLTFAVPAAKLKKKAAVIQRVFGDRAFRAIYESEKNRIVNKKRTDVDELLERIKARANTALKGEPIKDVLVEYINYVSLDQVRCARTTPTGGKEAAR